jgi:hypothetical protein
MTFSRRAPGLISAKNLWSKRLCKPPGFADAWIQPHPDQAGLQRWLGWPLQRQRLAKAKRCFSK